MKKNIAFLLPTLADGGAEKVAADLSLFLPEEKYNIYFILLRGNVVDYPHKGTIIDLKSNGRLRNPMLIIKNVQKIKEIKKKLNIAATISFLEVANMLNLLTRCQDKVILTIHSFKSEEVKRKGEGKYAPLIKLFYNKADAVVAISEAVREDLVQNFKVKEDKVKIIYNLYNFDAIKKQADEDIEAEYAEMFKKPVVANMGRLTEAKGQWHLIRAFKKVKEKEREAKLVILGRGKLRGYLQQLAADLGIEKDVIFLGFQSNPFKFIARAALFVFPSLYEGFALALTEAIACGVAVVSSDCKSGTRELLAPCTDRYYHTDKIEFAKYGVLVPVCDGIQYDSNAPLTKEESILADGIIRLLQDNSLRERYSRLSKERIGDFGLDKLIAQWVELI